MEWLNSAFGVLALIAFTGFAVAAAVHLVFWLSAKFDLWFWLDLDEKPYVDPWEGREIEYNDDEQKETETNDKKH